MTRKVQDAGGADDWTPGMWPRRLDPDTADRFLGGSVRPDDVPPGYVGVAELLRDARSVAGPVSAETASATVAAMQAAMADSAVRAMPRSKRLTKVLTVKGAVAAGVLVLAGGSAAAATGSLPGPVQNA